MTFGDLLTILILFIPTCTHHPITHLTCTLTPHIHIFIHTDTGIDTYDFYMNYQLNYLILRSLMLF